METISLIKKIYYKLLPYKKMTNAVLVIFYFSSMTEDEAGKIHDLLGSFAFTCPGVDIDKKCVSANYFKDSLDVKTIVEMFQKNGLSIIPDRIEIKPSPEHELNCISIVILVAMIYFIIRQLLIL